MVRLSPASAIRTTVALTGGRRAWASAHRLPQAVSLVAWGGTVIVSETTEFLGAEHLLVRRAATPAVARAIRRITRDNVAVALRDLAVGTEIRVRVAGARRRVYAREAIPPGAHVHLQNVRSRRVRTGKGRKG